MKINALYFKNGFLNWEVEEIEFGQINLLVGLSGSGKTQILNAIWFLRGIALGGGMNNVEWKINFTINGSKYEWYGVLGSLNRGTEGYHITKEHLQVLETNGKGKKSIRRKQDGSIEIIVDELSIKETVPKRLAGNGLLFQMYKDELDFVGEAAKGFKKMVLRDHTQSQADIYSNFYKTRFRYRYSPKYASMTLEELKNSNIPTSEKLIIAEKNNFEVIKDITNEFKSIFPEVFELNIVEISNPTIDEGHVEYQIKAVGSHKWIPHRNISSGMLRTLNYLIESYLSDDDTLFLIDEFENSLGHNCLPRLAEDIVIKSGFRQFIITTHHPDIINEFEFDDWIIITRNKGQIFNKKATELPFSRSLNEPYLALINHFDAQLNLTHC
jgi:AAA15 family ATPase/GTPase